MAWSTSSMWLILWWSAMISDQGSAPDFRLLFESLPGLYLVLLPDSPRFTIVAASDAYLRATLQQRDDIVGLGIFDAFPESPDPRHERDASSARASFARVLASRLPDTMATLRFDLARPGGELGGYEERWWSPLNWPVLDAQGRVAYIVHRVEDITAVAASFAALRSDEQTLGDLFIKAPDGIVVAEPDGRIIEVNDALCGLLGYARDELLGKTAFDLVRESDRARLRLASEPLKGGGVRVQEWVLQRKDGSLVPVEVREKLLPDGRLVSFARDITGHRRALEAVEDRERRKIARDLHDDLGQTLAAARMRLSTLCNAERVQERQAALEVARLIDQANQSTRSLAAQLAPSILYDLGLGPALEWLGQDIERMFGLKVVFMDDGQPKPLSVPVRSILYRATRELLINAAKHAKTAEAVVVASRQGDGVVVQVSDKGVGFDPARVTVTSRSGLGLLSVRERLSLVGGVVKISSSPDLGTVVEMRAPLGQDDAGEEVPLDAQARPDPARHTGSSLQELIDANAAQAVLLDRDGVIQQVNKAWQESAERDGDPCLQLSGPGVNYLEVCRRSAVNDDDSRLAWTGLRQVLDGSRSEFMNVYPCHTPEVKRWFLMHATVAANGLFLVSHMELTPLVDPVRIRASLVADG
jgi:PAS domain S-box-containing protein